jgi:hypothetical protein
MPIVVPCPHCSARIRAPENAAGRKAKCPKCRAPIIVSFVAPKVVSKIVKPDKLVSVLDKPVGVNWKAVAIALAVTVFMVACVLTHKSEPQHFGSAQPHHAPPSPDDEELRMLEAQLRAEDASALGRTMSFGAFRDHTQRQIMLQQRIDELKSKRR